VKNYFVMVILTFSFFLSFFFASYGFYYGAALLTQSSAVLYVSLFAHFCQMLFLTVVENPRIPTFSSVFLHS
jgi:hypothetical protein